VTTTVAATRPLYVVADVPAINRTKFICRLRHSFVQLELDPPAMLALASPYACMAFQSGLSPLPRRGRGARAAAVSSRGSVRMAAAAGGAAAPARKVLVVNTKGGGHAVIGPHLAESLLAAGHAVRVLQVGPESVKGPFARYTALAEQHPDRFSLAYGAVSPETVPAGVYDAVYDNNAKEVKDVHAVIDAGMAGAEVFYVSSAGAYVYDSALAPHIAGDSAKGPTVDVENALRASSVSSACFRPIYIIGPGSAKREYTDFFFDRIVRDRPLPIPGTGAEFTSITVRAANTCIASNPEISRQLLFACAVRGAFLFRQQKPFTGPLVPSVLSAA
jgi:hypothetical protein